jgi:hypothetical protein
LPPSFLTRILLVNVGSFVGWVEEDIRQGKIKVPGAKSFLLGTGTTFSSPSLTGAASWFPRVAWECFRGRR